MSQNTNSPMPGMSMDHMIILRSAMRDTVSDAVGCERERSLGDDYCVCDDDNGLSTLAILDEMEDLFDSMCEHAANKDEHGFHFSTNFDTTEYHLEYLKELANTVPWLDIREITYAEVEKTASASLWINSELGDSTNAWNILGHPDAICGSVYREKNWTFLPKRINEYLIWKDRHLAHFAKVTPSNTSFDKLMKGCPIGVVQTHDLPFVGELVGFDSPVKFWADYKLVGVDGTAFIMAVEQNDSMLFTKSLKFKNPEHKLPETVRIPFDTLAYMYRPEYKDYVAAVIE